MLELTIVYGLINSVMLAIVALGFSLTFGISGVSNFAYGAFYVLAGYTVWIFMHKLHIPFPVAAILALFLTAALGAALYRFVLLRVRGLVISEVIATFGVGLAILELFRYLGFTGFEYTLPVFTSGTVMILGVPVDHQRILDSGNRGSFGSQDCISSPITPRLGLAFRAIAQDERTALSLGINSDAIAGLSVAMGSAVAALAAILILPRGTISVNEGYAQLINAMAVCIIGGLGSTVGVIAAVIHYRVFPNDHRCLLWPTLEDDCIAGGNPGGIGGKTLRALRQAEGAGRANLTTAVCTSW